MMVAAISEAASKYLPNPRPTPRPQEERQQQIPCQNESIPSEKDNGVPQRRPRGRHVSSRYMSPSPSTPTSTSSTNSSYSSSRRCASPLVSRSINLTPASTPLPSTGPKRSQSADRRQPATPRSVVVDLKQRNATEVSAASKLLTTSTRSLSVSFQGESFSLPISRTKTAAPPAPNTSNARKVTSERRRSTPIRGKGDGNTDQVEHSKPDQHRWPGRTRQVNLGPNLLGRSLDCSGDARKLCGIGSGNVIRTLRQSVVDDSRRASFDGRLSLDLGNAGFLNEARQHSSESSVASDLIPSDNDSVSSGSTTGMQDFEVGKGRTGSRGIVSSSKFWQETNRGMRRFHDPGSPLSTRLGSRIAGPSKFFQSKKTAADSPSSSPRTMTSLVRPATRPASPSKLWTCSTPSPSRGLASPSRVRNEANGLLTINSSNPPSILSFAVDIRRGRMGEDRLADAHMLRLLYNCYLQWRFVNARANNAFLVQGLNAEKNLWNAWVKISELRHSVSLKRIKLFLLRKKLKLTSILRGQMDYLEEWAVLDRDHSNSLLGATKALEASILRLPVAGKSVVDIQTLKEAVSSAVDVMQAMASSIYSLLSKVEEINSLVTELAKVTSHERILLHKCKDILSTLATMQVKDCSLRTHILQLNRVETSSRSLTTRVELI